MSNGLTVPVPLLICKRGAQSLIMAKTLEMTLGQRRRLMSHPFAASLSASINQSR
jgi:hypothetical protein